MHIKGDSYTVDTIYKTGDKVSGEKDGKKGTWTFKEAPTYAVTYDWGNDVPDNVNLPKDSNKYYKGDKCTVDTAYKKGDTVPGTKDGKKGKWTFGGWDKTGEFDIEDNTVIKSSWKFKAKPVNSQDPRNPTDSNKPTNPGRNGGNSPKTGDNLNLALWILLLALAGMGVTGNTAYRRNRQK